MKAKNLHVGQERRSGPLLRAFGPALLWAALLFGLSSIPGGLRVARDVPGIDKLVHAVLFGILGALLARGFSMGTGLGPAGLVLTSVGMAALYGVSDELHQAFVPGRSPEILDLLADAAGAAIGAGAVVITQRRALRAKAVDS